MAAEPSVSPADTIRRLREDADASELGLAFMEGEDDLIADTVEDIALRRAAADNIAALLAVGERDTVYEDVPCEGSHFVAPGSFVACECEGFAAAESPGERHDRQIARLTEALQPFVESFRESYPEAFADLAHLPDPWAVPVIVSASQIRDAVAVLADEEDAPPHSFGEQGIRPEPNHTWPLADEEDAGNG